LPAASFVKVPLCLPSVSSNDLGIPVEEDEAHVELIGALTQVAVDSHLRYASAREHTDLLRFRWQQIAGTLRGRLDLMVAQQK